MYYMWVNHNLSPDEFYNKPFGAQTLLLIFTELEIEEKQKIKRQQQQNARKQGR